MVRFSTATQHTALLKFGTLSALAVATLSLSGCGGSNNLGGSGNSGGSTPTPVATATPTPGTGTPTPTPTATPGNGTGTRLGAFFGTTSSTAILTYRDVTTSTIPDPLTGQSSTSTTTTTYKTGGGNPFSSGEVGQKTQVTLATAQGNITVTRQEELDKGKLSGYTYYTLTNNAYTLYGGDDIDEQGRTTSRTRYNPGASFSLDLQPGQTATQTVQVTQTNIDVEDNTTTTKTYSIQFNLAYLGIESVTVPAGTYAKAAKVTFGIVFNSPAQNGEGAVSSTSTVTGWYSAPVGLVKSLLDSSTTVDFPNPITGTNQTLVTKVQSDTQLTAISGG